MVLTHIGPGSVQFSTTPTDAELAEAAQLLEDLDTALGRNKPPPPPGPNRAQRRAADRTRPYPGNAWRGNIETIG